MFQSYFFVMFQSVIIFQMMYILLQYLYIKKREYIYYFGYMLCLSLYATLKYETHLDVEIFSIFDADAERHFDRALPLLAYFLYYRFARYFADIDQLIPRLNAILKRMEWFVLGYVLFELVWEFAGLNRQFSEYIFWCVSAFLFITTVYFGFWIFSKRNVLVNILILGAISVNIGSFATVVLFYFLQHGYYKVLDPMLPINVCIVVEMLLFTTGLAYKAKMVEREKLIAQSELLLQTQKNLQLSERVGEMRSSIADNFHNDLSASLSGIGIYSSLLLKAIKDKPEQVETIADKISDSATRLTDSIIDIIWALNPATKSLGDIVYKLKAFEKDELEPLNTFLNIQCNTVLNDMHLNVKAIRSIYLMQKLFARFMAKHGGCHEIKSTIFISETHLHLHVTCEVFLVLDTTKVAALKQTIGSSTDAMQANFKALKLEGNKAWLEAEFPITNIRD